MKDVFSPSRKEVIAGAVYLVVQAIAVPFLVAMAVMLLSIEMSLSMMNTVVFVINFLAVLLIFRKFLLNSARDFFATPRQYLKLAARGLGLYFLANLAWGIVLQLLGLSTANVNDSTIQDMLQEDMLPMVISIVFLAPLTEELLYRGVLLAPLYRRSKLGAYALSVVVFSLVHVVGYIGSYDLQTLALCFLQYLPPSLCLAWIYASSQNIYVSALVHTAVNAIGFLLLR